MHQPVAWAQQMGPSVGFLLPPRCLARRPGVKAAAPLFSAQPGAQKSATILELPRESTLISPDSPALALAGPGWSGRTRQ